VETKLPPGMQGQFDIAVGLSMFSGGVSWLAFFIGLFCGIALDTLGGILIFIGVVMWSRSKRRQQEEAA